MLLEGIERYGMGNWQDVANHIGAKSKNKAKVEQHYSAVYLNSDTKPLPVPIVGTSHLPPCLLLTGTVQNPNKVLNPMIYPKDPTNYGLTSESSSSPGPAESASQSVLSKRKLTADALAAGYRCGMRFPSCHASSNVS